MHKNIKKIHNVILCGGGIYGYAHVAVLKELQNYKEYVDIKNITGVSVGSIIAALYVAGYTPDELCKIMFDFNFDLLIRDSMFPYFKFYEKYGMYMAGPLEEEIERLIRNKTNIKYCTFSQVPINLSVVSTNLNRQEIRIFNRENTPEVPISKAVRMSISYPMVMTPVFFEGEYYCDGGISMNYPISLYKHCLDETIGVTFSAYNENDDGTLKDRIPIKDVYDFVRSVGVTMSRSAYVAQIKPKYLKRSIIVKIDQNISSTQFNLTKDQKIFIYDCGIKAAREQIHKILGITKHNDPIVVPHPDMHPKQNNDMLDIMKYIVTSDPKMVSNMAISK